MIGLGFADNVGQIVEMIRGVDKDSGHDDTEKELDFEEFLILIKNFQSSGD